MIILFLPIFYPILLPILLSYLLSYSFLSYLFPILSYLLFYPLLSYLFSILSYLTFYSTSNPISYSTFCPILSSILSYPILSFFLSFDSILPSILLPIIFCFPFYRILFLILPEPIRSYISIKPLDLRKLKKKKKIQLKIAAEKGKYLR